MQKCVSGMPLLFALATIVCGACDNNPAAGKPAAKVSATSDSAEVSTHALGSATAATKYVFSNAGSKLEFVGAKLTRKHEGAFHVFTGTIELVASDPEKSVLAVEVATASLTSDDPKLTAHLKSADLLDVAKYSKATFISSAITKSNEPAATHTVTGRLELHGVTKTISFPATVKVTPEAVDARAEFTINRQDFGIVYPGMPDDLIKDEVLLKLTIHGMNMPR